MINILILSANPKRTKRLRLDEEVRSIRERLNIATLRDHFRIEQEWALRVGDLQGHLMRHKPNIVHFSGYGNNEGEIVLEDEAGKSQAVPIPALDRLFAILKRSIDISCVVLNSCYSKDQANAIAKHIECVVGMSGAIGDEAAVSFAAAFYQALAFGQDIKTAYDLACNNIQLRGLAEHDIPELISRPGVDATDIYVSRKNAAPVSGVSEPYGELHTGHTAITRKTIHARTRRNRVTIITLGAVALAVALVTYGTFLRKAATEAKLEDNVAELSYSLTVQKMRNSEADGPPTQRPDASSPFANGDQLKLNIVKPQHAGYLYVLNQPSKWDGATRYIVSYPSDGDTKYLSGPQVTVPGPPDEWLGLDSSAGLDILWLVWSQNPVPELESVKELANQPKGEIKAPSEIARIQQMLATYSSISPAVQTDYMGNRTIIRWRGTSIAYPLRCEHR
jgi:hypothetical protein